MHYLPLAPTFFAFLVCIFIVVVVLIEIRVLHYPYLRIGVSSRVALVLLFGSLVGSFINVPVAHFPGRLVRSGQRLHPVVVKKPFETLTGRTRPQQSAASAPRDERAGMPA